MTIDLRTGEVKRTEKPADATTGSLFSDQMMAELLDGEAEAEALLAALRAAA